MNSLQNVKNFLEQKKIAVVGVSRKKTKFGNTIYRELKHKGYDVYPVNPFTNLIEGDKAYANLNSIPEKIDAVVINVPPQQALTVLNDVADADIHKVWFQQGSQSDDAEKFCEEHGIDCISNECILMFAQPSAFIHRAHKWLWGVIGKLPQ